MASQWLLCTIAKLADFYMAVGAQEEEKAILIILSLLIDVRLGLIQEKVVKTFVGL